MAPVSLPVAPAPADDIVSVAPAPPPREPTTALQAITLALRLDDVMYAATRNKGKVDNESWLPKARFFGGLATTGAVIAGTVAACMTWGMATPGPLLGGLAGCGLLFGLPYLGACNWAEKRHRTGVVPEAKARPLVDAYVAGDGLARRIVARAAARWSKRIAENEIGGVFVRRQLKELAAAKLPPNAKEERSSIAIDTIATALRSVRGGPLSAMDKDMLYQVQRAVVQLEGEDRRQVCAFLTEVLYKNEQPRFKTSDHGACQSLLETLADLQPFDGMSSAHLAELTASR